jgi:hypothetical protein
MPPGSPRAEYRAGQFAEEIPQRDYSPYMGHIRRADGWFEDNFSLRMTTAISYNIIFDCFRPRKSKLHWITQILKKKRGEEEKEEESKSQIEFPNKC